MTRISPAQQRVLDYLRAHDNGDFLDVPYGVSNDLRTFKALIRAGLIEAEVREVRTTANPIDYQEFYRAVRT